MGTRSRVAVLGAAGFFGRALLSRLIGDPSCEFLLALDHRAPRLRDDKLIYRNVDLTRPDASQDLAAHLEAHQIDTVVHLALLSSPSHHSNWAHEVEAIGTLHLLNACASHPVRKIVLFSSTLVYGAWRSNPNYLVEGSLLRGLPGSRYVADRIANEQQFAKFKHEHPETICCSLRFAPILGPEIRNWVTRYLTFPTPLTVLGQDPLLQFIHETDVIDALVLSLQRDVDGAVNLSGDGVLPLSAALRACGRVGLPMPTTLARAAVSAMWMSQLVSTPPSFVRLLTHLCVADCQRAQSELGFRPRHSSLDAVRAFAKARSLSDLIRVESSS